MRSPGKYIVKPSVIYNPCTEVCQGIHHDAFLSEWRVGSGGVTLKLLSYLGFFYKRNFIFNAIHYVCHLLSKDSACICAIYHSIKPMYTKCAFVYIKRSTFPCFSTSWDNSVTHSASLCVLHRISPMQCTAINTLVIMMTISFPVGIVHIFLSSAHFGVVVDTQISHISLLDSNSPLSFHFCFHL